MNRALMAINFCGLTRIIYVFANGHGVFHIFCERNLAEKELEKEVKEISLV